MTTPSVDFCQGRRDEVVPLTQRRYFSSMVAETCRDFSGMLEPHDVRRNERMRSLRGMVVALLWGILSSHATAQIWSAGDLLNLQTSRVNLLVRKGSGTEHVATVERVWVQRVVTATERLVPAFGVAMPTIFVMKGEAPNAFVTFNKDGQSVMVLNTAMLRLAGSDDNMIAAVVGHELGHLKANHLADGAAREGLLSLMGILAGLAVDIHQAKRGVDTRGAGMQIGDMGGQLVNAKFNRDQEREADNLGVKAMAQVGYDPSGASMLWRAMQDRFGGGSGLWLSSHPNHDERERAMSVAASSLKPTPKTQTSRTTTPASEPVRAADASRARSKTLGNDSYQIERMLSGHACNAAPVAYLTDKGPGFDSYEVECTAGPSLQFRCEYGNCIAVK